MDGAVACRGIRGAVGVDERGVERAITWLLDEVVAANGCALEDLAAVIFTLTDDLPDANPAAVARSRGWQDVPLLLVREHGGGTGIPRCVRVLVLWNTERAQSQVRHVYLGAAASLRPDLAAETPRRSASDDSAFLRRSRRQPDDPE